MLDNGYPLATESNVLKELIKPPSIVRNVVNTLTGESQLVAKCTLCLAVVGWGVKFFTKAKRVFLVLEKLVPV